MEQIFARRYGAAGTVLYPLSSQTPRASASHGPNDSSRFLRLGYAGTIAASNYPALDVILQYLDAHHGQFYFASPTYQVQRERITKHPCVTDLGQLTPRKVCELFSAHVDAMLVLQDFEPSLSICIQTAFPSKLVQYAQFNLPLLIVAPPNASAAQWARTHPDVCMVVTTQDGDAVCEALDALSDSYRRQEMVKKLHVRPPEEFSTEAIQKVFIETLQRCISSRR